MYKESDKLTRAADIQETCFLMVLDNAIKTSAETAPYDAEVKNIVNNDGDKRNAMSVHLKPKHNDGNGTDYLIVVYKAGNTVV